jgi:hypothetical protein
MADYTQLMKLEKKSKAEQLPSPVQSTGQSASQPTSQLVRQSTDQQTSQSTPLSDNKTVDRPKSFYITNRLDKRLDEAVDYIQEIHGIKKVDRSILVNAMLDNDAIWTGEALDLLVDRILRLLTNKMIR